jgi:hypothetical protein
LKGFWSHNKAMLSFVMALAGVIGLLAPAISVSPVDIWGKVQHFFQAQTYLVFPAERSLIALFVFGLLYNAAVAWRFRHRPVSVLSTRFELHFSEPDRSVVRVEREQRLRANRPDVTAYYMTMKPDPGGKINKKDIECWISPKNAKISDSVVPIGSPEAGWECMHCFEPHLPYAWYSPVIPQFVMRNSRASLPKFVRKLIIVQRVKTIYREDFNREEPSFNVTSTRYRQRNVTVDIFFHEDRTPVADQIVAQRIRANGVQNEEIERRRKDGKDYFRVYVGKLYDERVRIAWKLPEQGALPAERSMQDTASQEVPSRR